MRVTLLTIVCALLLHFEGSTQVAIGQWQGHLPMSSFKWVGETTSHYYAANQYGVLSMSKDELLIETHTKLNDLSGTGITCFECNSSGSHCIVGFEDGNMDIISVDNTITNQPAIKNSQITGDKRINDVTFTEAHALLSTGIGMVLLDLQTLNILENTRVNFSGENQHILKSTFFRDTLYMVTENHVLKCPYNSLFTFPTFEPVAFNRSPSDLIQWFEYRNNLYALYYTTQIFKEDTLYALAGNELVPTSVLAGNGIQYVDVRHDTLLVTEMNAIVEYDPLLNPIATIFTYGSEEGPSPTQALYSINRKNILISDNFSGGIVSRYNNQYRADIFSLSSPTYNTSDASNGTITRLAEIDGDIYALPGGSERTYLRPKVYRYRDNDWNTTELVNASYPYFVNANAIVPYDEKYLISSERGGVAIMNDNMELELVYNEFNSPIHDLQNNDYNYYGITGVCTDGDGTYYMLHDQSAQPLKILHPDNTWTSISLSLLGFDKPATGEIIRLENGYLILYMREAGLVVYDDNGTPKITADDQMKVLNTSPNSGNLPSNNVSAMVQDLDGELWIGTAEGIGVFYAPENFFTSGGDEAQRIIVKQDGYNGYLFETETVEDIAVDGANRKWVGTFNSGLFLISSDGLDQLEHFTTTNSPLLGNHINDIEIDPKTGAVFVATDYGLLSYRSDATGAATDLEAIAIFPNPVQSGYNGNIAISNVTNNAYIRITDAAGSLVYETRSNGGQAIWDGHNSQGERVQSGIYLIHVTTQPGDIGKTAKVMIF